MAREVTGLTDVTQQALRIRLRRPELEVPMRAQSLRLASALVPLFLVAAVSAQSVQYRSPAGVEYRSMADTGAVARAQAALTADPRNVSLDWLAREACLSLRQFKNRVDAISDPLSETTSGLASKTDGRLV